MLLHYKRTKTRFWIKKGLDTDFSKILANVLFQQSSWRVWLGATRRPKDTSGMELDINCIRTYKQEKIFHGGHQPWKLKVSALNGGVPEGGLQGFRTRTFHRV